MLNQRLYCISSHELSWSRDLKFVRLELNHEVHRELVAKLYLGFAFFEGGHFKS